MSRSPVWPTFQMWSALFLRTKHQPRERENPRRVAVTIGTPSRQHCGGETWRSHNSVGLGKGVHKSDVWLDWTRRQSWRSIILWYLGRGCTRVRCDPTGQEDRIICTQPRGVGWSIPTCTIRTGDIMRQEQKSNQLSKLGLTSANILDFTQYICSSLKHQ